MAAVKVDATLDPVKAAAATPAKPPPSASSRTASPVDLRRSTATQSGVCDLRDEEAQPILDYFRGVTGDAAAHRRPTRARRWSGAEG